MFLDHNTHSLNKLQLTPSSRIANFCSDVGIEISATRRLLAKGESQRRSFPAFIRNDVLHGNIGGIAGHELQKRLLKLEIEDLGPNGIARNIVRSVSREISIGGKNIKEKVNSIEGARTLAPKSKKWLIA